MGEKMDENERFALKWFHGRVPYLRDNLLHINIPIRSVIYRKLLNHYENRISDLEKQISILKQEIMEKGD